MRDFQIRRHPLANNVRELFVAGNPYPIGFYAQRAARSFYAYSNRTHENKSFLTAAEAVKFIKSEMYSVWKIRK